MHIDNKQMNYYKFMKGTLQINMHNLLIYLRRMHVKKYLNSNVGSFALSIISCKKKNKTFFLKTASLILKLDINYFILATVYTLFFFGLFVADKLCKNVHAKSPILSTFPAYLRIIRESPKYFIRTSETQ